VPTIVLPLLEETKAPEAKVTALNRVGSQLSVRDVTKEAVMVLIKYCTLTAFLYKSPVRPQSLFHLHGYGAIL
jgi:hypothetical protein